MYNYLFYIGGKNILEYTEKVSTEKSIKMA